MSVVGMGGDGDRHHCAADVGAALKARYRFTFNPVRLRLSTRLFGVVLVGNDLYVANSDAVLHFPYVAGDTHTTAPGIVAAVLRQHFFARRYAHRAVVLETVATVPGMVGGAL